MISITTKNARTDIKAIRKKVCSEDQQIRELERQISAGKAILGIFDGTTRIVSRERGAI